MTVLLAEIMTSPGFGEVMFLVALVLFALAALVRLVRRPEFWFDGLLIAAGFSAMALGWLSLTTGD